MKDHRLKKLQKYLKRLQSNWRQFDKSYDIRRQYDSEPYVILSSRNDKNPNVLEIITFINTLDEAQAVMNHGIAFNYQLLDIDQEAIIAHRYRRIRPGEDWWKE